MKGVVAALFLAAVAASANECPSDWTQEKLLEHSECDKFYKCTYGEPVEQDCFTGLYFNINNWQCDWPANVDCGERTMPGEDPATDATTEAQPEPTTEAQPEPEPTTEAQTKPETEPTTEAQPEPAPTTEAQPEPKPTTEAQPEPEPTTEAQPEPKPTTEAQPESEPETEPATEAQPEPEPTTEAEPASTEEPSTTPAPEFLENGCPVDPQIHWLLPAEDDCNGFYYCVWGEKVLRACPATLHFNSRLQVCDWPGDAGCATSFNKHAAYSFDRRF